MMGGQRTLETSQSKPPAGHPKNSKKLYILSVQWSKKAPETPFHGRFRGLFSWGAALISPLKGDRHCLKGWGVYLIITDTPTGMHHVGSAYGDSRDFSGGFSHLSFPLAASRSNR